MAASVAVVGARRGHFGGQRQTDGHLLADVVVVVEGQEPATRFHRLRQRRVEPETQLRLRRSVGVRLASEARFTLVQKMTEIWKFIFEISSFDQSSKFIFQKKKIDNDKK